MTVHPIVVAHRGASAHRAEHTLAAYELALQQGARALECDVRLTQDGHLVCMHDRKVDRTSNGRGVVSTLSLSRMSELDYGRWHDELPESADGLVTQPVAPRPVDPADHSVLTLESLLELVADHPGVTLFVETKHPVRYAGLVERRLVSQLARYGLCEPSSTGDAGAVVMSFSSLAVRRVWQQAPAVPTVLLMRELPAARRDGSLPQWATMTGPGIQLLREDPGYVARAAAQGHDTYCWTVDAPEDVRLCEELGVKYLATNSPVRTRALLDG